MPKPYSDPARKAWPFLALFVVVGAALMIPFGMQAVRDYRIARVYVATQCQVTGERTVTSTSSSRLGGRWMETQHSHKEFTWVYRVGGRKYTADGFDNHSGVMADSSDMGNITPGSKHECWYDPAAPQESVLVRKFHGKFYLGALIPGMFMLIGGMTLRGLLRRKPMAVDASVSQGSMLAVRLAPDLSTKGVFGCLGLMVVVLGIALVFLYLGIRRNVLDDGFGWFLLGGIVAEGFLIRHLYRAMRAAGVPDPVVEIDAEPLTPGQHAKLYIRQDGPARIAQFKVSLVCIKDGGKPSTNHRILNREALEIGQSEEFQGTFTVPAKAPPSTKTVQTSTLWNIRVRRELVGGVNYDTDYPFRVVADTEDSERI